MVAGSCDREVNDQSQSCLDSQHFIWLGATLGAELPPFPPVSQTVTTVPSNFLKVKPSKSSLYFPFWSRRILIAMASPSLSDSIPSVRQCTPAMLRPVATLEASLFSSPSTV